MLPAIGREQRAARHHVPPAGAPAPAHILRRPNALIGEALICEKAHTVVMRRAFIWLALLLLANALWCVSVCSANEIAPEPPCHHHEETPSPCAHVGFSAALSAAPLLAIEDSVAIQISLIPPNPIASSEPITIPSRNCSIPLTILRI